VSADHDHPRERRCDGCGEPNPAGNLLCRACGARLDVPRAGPPGGEAGRLVQIRRKGSSPPGAAPSLPVAATADKPLITVSAGVSAGQGGPPATEGSLRPISWPWLAVSVVVPFMLSMALMLLLGRSTLLANAAVAAGLVGGAALATMLRGPGAQLLEPVLGTATVYIVAAVVTGSWRDAAAPRVPLVVHLFMVLVVGALGYGGGWLGRWARTRARSST
jgi:hypothetical protein